VICSAWNVQQYNFAKNYLIQNKHKLVKLQTATGFQNNVTTTTAVVVVEQTCVSILALGFGIGFCGFFDPSFFIAL